MFIKLIISLASQLNECIVVTTVSILLNVTFVFIMNSGIITTVS